MKRIIILNNNNDNEIEEAIQNLVTAVITLENLTNKEYVEQELMAIIDMMHLIKNERSLH